MHEPSDNSREHLPQVQAPPRHASLRLLLLAVWAASSFGVCYFARDLNFLVADQPLAYWLASQGILLVFIALVVIYATVCNRAERRAARHDV